MRRRATEPLHSNSLGRAFESRIRSGVQVGSDRRYELSLTWREQVDYAMQLAVRGLRRVLELAEQTAETCRATGRPPEGMLRVGDGPRIGN